MSDPNIPAPIPSDPQKTIVVVFEPSAITTSNLEYNVRTPDGSPASGVWSGSAKTVSGSPAYYAAYSYSGASSTLSMPIKASGTFTADTTFVFGVVAETPE